MITNDKYNVILNWGLGLGIASVFFHETFVIPVLALIVNYYVFINYNYMNKDKRLWRGIIGFCLGVIYFLVFLYVKEKSYGYSIDIVETVFKRQALVFLIFIGFLLYHPIKDFRKSGGFKSMPSFRVNPDSYMKGSSLNKQQEGIRYNDITNSIIKLSEMVDKGILTQEEFESKKKDLLNRL